ncbi:MAG: hypothetical protein ICV76_07570 [Nitrospiraceae bacterium]|nr:hypothetical protein [Nitrospiraceae bacterium]
MRTLFGQIGASGAVHKDEVQDVVREIVIVTRTLTNPAAFMAISRFSKLDPSLSDHALSVCALALILGKAVGCSVTALHHLATGALLHDVGLFQIPTHLRASGRANVPPKNKRFTTAIAASALFPWNAKVSTMKCSELSMPTTLPRTQ